MQNFHAYSLLFQEKDFTGPWLEASECMENKSRFVTIVLKVKRKILIEWQQINHFIVKATCDQKWSYIYLWDANEQQTLTYNIYFYYTLTVRKYFTKKYTYNKAKILHMP